MRLCTFYFLSSGTLCLLQHCNKAIDGRWYGLTLSLILKATFNLVITYNYQDQVYHRECSHKQIVHKAPWQEKNKINSLNLASLQAMPKQKVNTKLNPLLSEAWGANFFTRLQLPPLLPTLGYATALYPSLFYLSTNPSLDEMKCCDLSQLQFSSK